MKIKLEKYFPVCFEENMHSHLCHKSLTCWAPNSIRGKGAYSEHNVVESNIRQSLVRNTCGEDAIAVEDVNGESKESITQMVASRECFSFNALLEPLSNEFVEINCNSETIGEQKTTLEGDLAEKALGFEAINNVLKEIEEHNLAPTFLDKEV